MTNAHLSGGSIAALIAFCSTRYGWGISSDESLTIGAAAFSVGAGLIHLAKGPGIVPAIVSAVLGPKE